MTASIKTRMALTARVRIRWRNSCSSGILWSDDSIFAASAVDVVRFLETGIVSSLFCWKNVTRTFYACSILSNLPLEKWLPVHNKRDGVPLRPHRTSNPQQEMWPDRAWNALAEGGAGLPSFARRS